MVDSIWGFQHSSGDHHIRRKVLLRSNLKNKGVAIYALVKTHAPDVFLQLDKNSITVPANTYRNTLEKTYFD